MGDVVKIVTSDFVELNITNSKDNAVCFQRRFPKWITTLDFKGKLEIITGGNSSTMSLQLFDKDDVLVGALDRDESPLGSYQIENGMRVHVTDNFSYEEPLAEKFVLTEDQYNNRTDTLKHYLKTNQLGKYNTEIMKKRQQRKEDERLAELERTSKIQIGDRCEARTTGQPPRKGTVMYKGNIDGQKGAYIGVKFDEPLGKNDGSINGKRYFECAPNYGGFIRSEFIEVGEFPEESYDFDDEI